MTKTVLFDLDGTLFDTGPDFEYIVNGMLAEQGKGPIDYPPFREIISQGSPAMVQKAFKLNVGDPTYEATLKTFYEIYLEEMGRYAQLFPGVAKLLDHFDAHHVPWGIVTNRQSAYIPKMLKKFGLFERTHCIVGADTTPHRKPHPAPLLHGAKLLNTTAENCLYVGDYPSDIVAAKAANMGSVAVTWGYHQGVDTLKATLPDYLIDLPDELLTIIQ
jgi:2-phosphoglycolate phosphatase